MTTAAQMLRMARAVREFCAARGMTTDQLSPSTREFVERQALEEKA